MKSQIYYAICFELLDSTGRTIGHEDPAKAGAWGLFYRKSTALEHASATDKIVPVSVTIGPVKKRASRKATK